MSRPNVILFPSARIFICDYKVKFVQRVVFFQTRRTELHKPSSLKDRIDSEDVEDIQMKPRQESLGNEELFFFLLSGFHMSTNVFPPPSSSVLKLR